MLKLKTCLLGIIFTYFFSTVAYGSDIRIESYDKTILSGQSQGSTFLEVLNQFAETNDINIIYKKNAGKTVISSINNITNNTFGDNDGWMYYIERNGEIIQNSNILKTNLVEGDKLIVYYGDIDETKIIPPPILTIDNNVLNFQFVGSYKLVSGRKIHVITPKKTQRILISDESEILTTGVSDLGYYKYYLENYNYSSYPEIVKSETIDFFVGPIDNNKVTRGEVIDFIINYYGITTNENANVFVDANPSDFYYNEMITAYNKNIVSGYSNKTFGGNKSITLSELAVILKRTKEDTLEYKNYKTNAPTWAASSVNYCIELGIFDKNDDFLRLVTVDDLLAIN